MDIRLSPLSLILLPAALLTASLALLAWRRRTAPGARALAALAVAVTWWELTSVLCIEVQTLGATIFWAQVQHVAINAVPLLWFAFCAGYSRRHQWITPRRLALLAVVPALATLLAATNGWHHLIWSRVELVRDDWGVRGVFHHGPAFWAAVLYAYLLLLAGSVLLLRTVTRLPTPYARQGRVLLLGLAIPWVGNLLYLADLTPIPGLDFTPFSFTLTVLLMTWGIFRTSLLDLAPIARDIVLDHMVDGVLVVDLYGRVIDANLVGREWAGMGDQLIGASTDVLPWPSLVERLRAPSPGVWELGAEETLPMRLEAHLSPVPGHDGRAAGWLVLLRDVSVRAEAVQLREELIALVSHELRTPLTAVVSALRLLGAGAGQLDPSARRMLDIAERNSQRMLRLTRDLLDLQRLKADVGSVRSETVPLGPLLREVCDELHPTATSSGITLLAAPTTVAVHADRERLIQVLVNLVGNAIKFTPPGGRVELSATPSADGRMVQVTVRDTGRGIPSDQLQAIFEPFAQGGAHQRASEGAGLGLAICRAIVLRHGGRIWAESAPGQGSRFHFTLPAVELASTGAGSTRRTASLGG